MSGLISREFINELINRTDIVELVESRVPLKKAGRNYQACCPFHAEKSPSFTVSSVKQFYHCFGCGVSGNAIGFLIAYDRMEFVDAVETLAKQLGLEVPREESSHNHKSAQTADLYFPLQKSSERYQQALRQSPKAIQYLKNRGLNGEIAKIYQIGYSPNDQYDAFRDRIVFPIRDRRGRVVGFGGRVLDDRLPKYINSSDSPVFHKSNILYGLYEARQANRELKKIIIVEGYMDVVSLAAAGISYAVATLGTATTTQHISQLFQQTHQIIFCFDGDNAGRKAAWRALESTLSVLRDDVEARFLFLPDGEDPDSLVKKEGKDVFLTRLDQSQSLADFFWSHLKTQANIHSIEGRAQYTKLALPYIENISAPIFKEMMLDQLASAVRLEKSQLHQFVSQTQTVGNKTASKIQRTPMRLAIALLLQNPELSHKIPTNIDLLSLSGSDLFKEIILLLRENSEWTTGNLLEIFREKSESELVHKLSAWNHGVPEEGISAEFLDILQHLQKLQRQKEIEKLLQKANQNSLSEPERMQLQSLLLEK